MSMDLDRDVTINGHEFKAGKGVNTSVQEADPETGKTTTVDYAEAIKDIVKANKEATDYAGVHHGEVASSADPLEVTEQTPTRPLPDAPDASNPEELKGNKK